MRVLFTNEAPLIRCGLAEGFKQAGHEVLVLSDKNRLWDKMKNEQAEIITNRISDFKPDLVISEGFAGIAIKEVYTVINKHKIPFFYWAIEDPVAMNISVAHFPYADYIFTTTQEKLEFYANNNKKASVLTFACNPEVHKNVGMYEQYKHDIVLVGANYSSRYDEAEWLVMPLVEAGYDIKIWGIWWDDISRPINLANHPEVYGGILPYEDLAKVYSSAKIVLGMNCDDTSITQTSMRPYEVAGCGGGVYLGHYTKAVENIFKGKLLQVKNKEQVKLSVDLILDNYDAHKEYIDEAQRFVYALHTYKHRAEQIANVYNELYG